MFTFENFFIETYGKWKACKTPTREPDYVSYRRRSTSVSSEVFEIFKERPDYKFASCDEDWEFGSRYMNLASSVYWYGENKRGKYVIRLSDHWSNRNKRPDCGRIASCYWDLSSPNGSDYWQAGKIYLNDLKPKTTKSKPRKPRVATV